MHPPHARDPPLPRACTDTDATHADTHVADVDAHIDTHDGNEGAALLAAAPASRRPRGLPVRHAASTRAPLKGKHAKTRRACMRFTRAAVVVAGLLVVVVVVVVGCVFYSADRRSPPASAAAAAGDLSKVLSAASPPPPCTRDGLKRFFHVDALPLETTHEGTPCSYAGIFEIREFPDGWSPVPLANASATNASAGMFWWYFPAQQALSSNPPLLLWLQGGPGATGMIGLWTEHGPLRLAEGADGPEVRKHLLSWGKHFDLLFVDSPVGTGFSYVGKPGHHGGPAGAGAANTDDDMDGRPMPNTGQWVSDGETDNWFERVLRDASASDNEQMENTMEVVELDDQDAPADDNQGDDNFNNDNSNENNDQGRRSHRRHRRIHRRHQRRKRDYVDKWRRVHALFGASACYRDGYAANSAAVARDLLLLLRGFYVVFPEKLDAEMYITGESYAGKYAPALATLIHSTNIALYHGDTQPTRNISGDEQLVSLIDNTPVLRRSALNDAPMPRIKLAGIAMGNPLIDPVTQVVEHAAHAYALGLVSSAQRDDLAKAGEAAASLAAKGDWLAALEKRELLFAQLANFSGGVNMYDVRLAEHYDRTRLYKYFRLTDTHQALNIPPGTPFNPMSGDVFARLAGEIMRPSAPLVAALLDENYKVLVYHGAMDLRDGWAEGEPWTLRLMWAGADGFRAAPRQVWRLTRTALARTEAALERFAIKHREDETPMDRETVPVGYVSMHKNLVHVTIRNAGHLVPMDQPVVSWEMMRRWIMGEGFQARPVTRL